VNGVRFYHFCIELALIHIKKDNKNDKLISSKHHKNDRVPTVSCLQYVNTITCYEKTDTRESSSSRVTVFGIFFSLDRRHVGKLQPLAALTSQCPKGRKHS